jgi:gamma-glutamylcyclotransferase (GGCT)/AIG2-like uncharacterized protein YtfP
MKPRISGKKTSPFHFSFPFAFFLFLLQYALIMTPTVDLFVYGTLLDESCLRALVGRSFPKRQATLIGFQRRVSTTGYPYIQPCPTAYTEGVLLLGVDHTTLAMLDLYEEEGCLYHRRPVTVLVEKHAVVCETYIGNVAVLSPNDMATDNAHRRSPQPSTGSGA